jgi:putative phosphonate metabolism protein
MSSTSPTRYALYYAPAAETALWRFGSDLLGYDAMTGQATQAVVPDGQTADSWMALTREPRRYGFHATLKAPFYLNAGMDEAELHEAMDEFKKMVREVQMPSMILKIIGSFIALVPSEPNPHLQNLAAQTVEYFDRFRAPLTDHDRQRRLKSPLTERQIGYLDRWGYPYVMEDFRFHMTLTGPVHADERDALHQTLKSLFIQAALDYPVNIDRLVLFKQSDSKHNFRIVHYVDLASD